MTNTDQLTQEFVKEHGHYPQHKDHSPEMKTALATAQAQKREPLLDWEGIIWRDDQLFYLQDYISEEDYAVLKAQDDEITGAQTKWVKDYGDVCRDYYEGLYAHLPEDRKERLFDSCGNEI